MFVKTGVAELTVGSLRLTVDEGEMPPDEIRLWDGNPRIKHLLAGMAATPDDKNLRALAVQVQSSSYSKLRTDIQSFGQQEPVFIRPVKAGPGHVERATVLEGNTRVAILKELHERKPEDAKFSTVKAYLLPYDFPEKHLVTLMAHYHIKGDLRNQWDRYQIGSYMYQQVKLQRLVTQAEMAGMISRSQSWVSRMMQVYGLALEYKDELETEMAVGSRDAEIETNERFSLLEEAWKVKTFRDKLDLYPAPKKTLFRWVHQDKFKDHRSIRSIDQIYSDEVLRNAVEAGGAGAGDKAAASTEKKAPINTRIEEFAKWIEAIPIASLADVDPDRVSQMIVTLQRIEGILRKL